MMKDFETEFAKLISELRLNDRPDERHKEDVRRRMLEEFNRTEAKDGFAIDGLHRIWRTIMESRLTKIAVAAIVIVAVLFGIGRIVGSDETKPVIVKDRPKVEGKIETQTPSVDIEPQQRLATEMELADVYFANADVAGLMELLETGQFESKVLAANYLADLGAGEAFEAIEKLADEWTGDGKNPFSAAVESLRKTMEEEPVEEAAKNQQPDEITESQKDINSVIDDQPREYEEVTNAYIYKIDFMRDDMGETSYDSYKVWIRLPDHIREETANQLIIDNGKKRLTLNKETMESQYSGSHISERPLEEHHILKFATDLFRHKDDSLELEAEITGEEDNGRTLVYSLNADDGQYEGYEGYAKVDKASMLPLEFEAFARPEGMNPNRAILTCTKMKASYDLIDDSVFEMDISSGFTELDEKRLGVFSGYVVDELGNPMAGAQVKIRAVNLQVGKASKTHNGNRKFLEGVTDDEGYFEISLPVLTEALWSPVVVYAVYPDQEDYIAWTMLRSKLSEKEYPLGDYVPGSVGEIIVWEGYGEDAAYKQHVTQWCAGASDIVLVMEPAGRVVGKVTDGHGEPIAKATISIEPDLVDITTHHPLMPERMWHSTWHTDEDGYYEVNGLPSLWKNCSLLMKVRADGYTGTEKYWSLQKKLDVEEMDITLFESIVTVRGTLVDNYGTALAERKIMARVDGRDRYNTCVTTTDKDGKFELKGCPYAEDLQIKAQLSRNSMSLDEKEKYESYVFYPDVITDVGCVAGKLEYEVNMTAVLPELVIDVEIVDSAGEPIPHFPVGVRASEPLSMEWNIRHFLKRADEYGKLRLTGVPDMEGLKLGMYGDNATVDDNNLRGDDKEFIEDIMKEYSKYRWTEVPIEVEGGVKEYSVRAVILTREEYQRDMELNNQ